jgi:hypothetical protein
MIKLNKLGKAILMAVSALAVGTMLSSCMTGEKFSRLKPGMTKMQVVNLMGNPKGYQNDGTQETLQYPGGRISGWSYDSADFYATFRNGLLSNYGATNVQKGQNPYQMVFFHQF